MLAVGLSALTSVTVVGAGRAEPFVPADPDTVIAELPERDGEAWRTIRALRDRLEATPASDALTARLVHEYLQLFRIEGNPRLLGYAAAALAPWDDVARPPRALAMQRAALAGLQHRFDDAAAELETVLEEAPNDAQAWWSRSAIHLTRAEYDASERACARLARIYDALVSRVCLAAVQALTGRAEQAYAFLDSSLSARPPVLAPGIEAWAATLAAETAVALGRDEAAARHFDQAARAERAVNGRPSNYLTTTHADFLLARNQPRQALALLDGAPSNDATLLRRARAQRMQGEPIATETETLRFRLQLALSGRDPTHAREAAYFALYLDDDATTALRLAADNWSRQREIGDAALLLAASVERCEPRVATPVIDWLDANDVEHVRLAELRSDLERCS